MKHFIIESAFNVPFEQLGETLPEHRRFLQRGYEANRLLCSGPQSTQKGGIMVARASSLEEIQGFFAEDPYQKKGLATYRFIEFSPVLYHKLIESWVAASE